MWELKNGSFLMNQDRNRDTDVKWIYGHRGEGESGME